MRNYSDYAEKAKATYEKYHKGRKTTENSAERDQVIRLATDILAQRGGFSRGGGFTQAIIDNDLYGAVSTGEREMMQYLPFFVYVNINAVSININQA